MEELEKKLGPGGDDTAVGHFEATANLHREVGLLWEGIGDLLRVYPDERTADDVLHQELPSEQTSPDSISLSAAAQQVSRMLRDQENFDIPMHLEHLPMGVAIKALLNDVDRVRAAAKYISSIKAKAAATQKPAPVIERKRSSLTLPTMDIEPAVDVSEPPGGTKPAPQTDTERTSPRSAGLEETLSTPDSGSGRNSFRDSVRSDNDVQEVVGGDLEEGYDSRQDSPAQGKGLNEYSICCDKRDAGV